MDYGTIVALHLATALVATQSAYNDRRTPCGSH